MGADPLGSEAERAGTEKVPHQGEVTLAWKITVLEVACQLFESRAKKIVYLPGNTVSIPLALAAPQDEAPIYEHHQTRGKGDTALKAIDDWYRNLPSDPIGTLVWRLRPVIDSDRDYAADKMLWRVHARFAIIPPE